jgi:hypothetical protein
MGMHRALLLGTKSSAQNRFRATRAKPLLAVIILGPLA